MIVKRAVLVGINEYPEAPLSGCVNDITDMADILCKAFKFKKKDIRLLSDKRATKKAIISRLRWLINGLKAGDVGVFHYSGHGAQVATRNPKEELDGLDEIICCVDFDWDDPNTYIKDKEFVELFKELDDGARILWVSDSCHSGDLDRNPIVIRAYPTNIDHAWRVKAIKEVKFATSFGPAGCPPSVVFISGCQSNQTSADAWFKKRANGALTRCLIDSIAFPETAKYVETLSELVQHTTSKLRDKRFTQLPVLIGGPDFLKMNPCEFFKVEDK